jgi:hypothetical protein
MKKILFIAILSIISSAPAYAAAGGNGVGHGAGGQHKNITSSVSNSNHAATPHHRAVVPADKPEMPRNQRRRERALSSGAESEAAPRHRNLSRAQAHSPTAQDHPKVAPRHRNRSRVQEHSPTVQEHP